MERTLENKFLLGSGEIPAEKIIRGLGWYRNDDEYQVYEKAFRETVPNWEWYGREVIS